jgi:S1-C subfamily serine protease
MQTRTRYALILLTLGLGVSYGVAMTSRLGISASSSDSPGERAGLNAGDIIMTINRRAVRSAAEARRELARAQPEPVFVLLWRRGAELFLQMRRG